jgi:hypothetical protein
MYEHTRIDDPRLPLPPLRTSVTLLSSPRSASPSSSSTTPPSPCVARKGEGVDFVLELGDLVSEEGGAQGFGLPFSLFGDDEKGEVSGDGTGRTGRDAGVPSVPLSLRWTCF